MRGIHLLTSLTNFKSLLDKTDTTNDRMIELMIQAASDDCDRFTRRNLRGRTYGSGGLSAEFQNGNGTPRLYARQYPIVSVTSLYDDPDLDFGSDTLKAATDYTIFADDGIIQLNRDAVLGTIFTVGTANVKLIYNAGYDEFQIIDGVNDKLDFEETASTELTATVAEGVYTASGLATALDTALTAAGASAFTITYDYFEGKFKLASDRAGGGGTFTLLWSTGTNAYRTIGRTLGFQVDADDTNAADHTSNDSVLGIPGDLEWACLEIALRYYKQSKIGEARFDIESRQFSGQGGGTLKYNSDPLPPHVASVLRNYQRKLV